MRTVTYTNSDTFKCLENLKGTSTEITLVHFGKEKCKPYHAFSGLKDEFIIHFVLSGRGFYSTNGNTIPLSCGQMFLIYPHEPVVYCADRTEPWSYVWIGFNGSKAESILKQCGFTKSNLVLPSPDTSEILSCFDDLLNHITLRYSDILYRESVLLKFLSVLCSQSPADDSAQEDAFSDNAYVKQAIDFINALYMQGITVSDIADHVGISRTHLNHLFQANINRSVQSFLMDFRMQKAAYLLDYTTMPIKEVSRNVGYTDPLVFSKAFKGKYGLSPKQYRAHEDVIEFRDKKKEPNP